MISSLEVNLHLLSLLDFLITKLFLKENYCTVVYYDQHIKHVQSECNHQCQFHAAVEQKLLLYIIPLVWIAVGTEHEESQVKSAIGIGCQSYIIFTQNATRFLEIKLYLNDRTEQRIRDTNFLMLCENVTSLIGNPVFSEALNYYPNFWIVIPSESVGYEILTQNYSSIDSVQLYSENSVDLLEDSNSSIFCDKIFNLGGRNVNVGVVDYGPYCLTENVGGNRGNADAFNSTLSKELQIEGLEGNLIIEFCKLRNCNLKLLPFGPDNWGYIDENGTGDGMLYATFLKKTELSICCASIDWVQDILDGSHSIAYSSMKILVPRAKLLPTYLTPVYPFDPSLWLSIFLTTIAVTIILHGLTALNSFRDALDQPPFVKSIFDTIAIYLDQGIFLNFATLSYRILVCFIMLSGVVLSNSYSGGLASVLTIPRFEKSLETIHNFALSAYRWAAPSIAWTFTIADAESPDLQAVVRKIEVIPDPEQLYQRSLRGDIGIGIELLNSQKFYVGPYIREDNVHLFETLKQITYYDYTAGVSQRGWPLMGYFNKFVLEVVQGGFVIYWEKDMLRKFQSNRLALALEPIITGRKPDADVQKLAVGHIMGPLYLLFIGAAVAIVVFAVELVWHSLKACWSDHQIRVWE